MVESLLQYDITVNTVAPPAVESEPLRFIETKRTRISEKIFDIIPKGRGAYDEEIADAVWYLATEEAWFITGQVISVNGGSTML